MPAPPNSELEAQLQPKLEGDTFSFYVENERIYLPWEAWQFLVWQSMVLRQERTKAITLAAFEVYKAALKRARQDMATARDTLVPTLPLKEPR